MADVSQITLREITALEQLVKLVEKGLLPAATKARVELPMRDMLRTVREHIATIRELTNNPKEVLR